MKAGYARTAKSATTAAVWIFALPITNALRARGLEQAVRYAVTRPAGLSTGVLTVCRVTRSEPGAAFSESSQTLGARVSAQRGAGRPGRRRQGRASNRLAATFLRTLDGSQTRPFMAM